MSNKVITFDEAISLANARVIQTFKDWAFDERDNAPDVDEILKELLKRPLRIKEKKILQIHNAETFCR